MLSSGRGRDWAGGKVMAMTSVKGRLARLEKEQRFKRWFEINDLLERFTDEELKIYSETGELPESVLRDSFVDRPSKLDGLDRKALLKLFEEHELAFGSRSDEEIRFHVTYGYWPVSSTANTFIRSMIERNAPRARSSLRFL
jgi:hypothetical protein